MKVVSLLPSATEMVYALGAGGSLVGRSHECDYPPEARGLPIVMRARQDFSQMSSAQIDKAVQARMKAHDDLYELDGALLAKLAPDLVLTQDLCHVCSSTPQSIAGAVEKLEHPPQVVNLSPRNWADVGKDLQTVADALGIPDRGKSLRADIERRARAAEPPERGADSSSAPRSRVAVLEWLDPPILAGLWVPEMIKRAGGTPLASKGGGMAMRTSWDELRGLGADLVVVAPCAFTLERTLGELRGPQLHPLEDLHPDRGVWAADEAFFSRPGPRLVEGLELLSDLIHGPGRPRRSFEGRATPAFRKALNAYRIPTRR